MPKANWFWGPLSPLGLGVALLTVLVDQAHKAWMLYVYDIGARGTVTLTPFFDLILVWNQGISYGLLPQESAAGRWGLILFAVAASLALAAWLAHQTTKLAAISIGLIIGGISGFFGGGVDDVIQRFIEFIRSIPTLPLWMALAAALPKEWSPQRVYFTITILLGLLGWTHLARRVRGKLLSLREEDFVVAARIAGSSNSRIIARHLLPSFLSYIIVDLSISFPYMILAETSLSFIGLGLRAPVISWGVLLQDAQNIQAIALYPWLFTPVAFVIVSVMAFSFVGDGMRDAADPDGAVLVFTQPEWDAFVGGVADGEFDV